MYYLTFIFSLINKVNIVYLFYYGLKAYILVNAHIYDGLLFGQDADEVKMGLSVTISLKATHLLYCRV